MSASRLALACLLLACGPSAPMDPSDASTSDPGSTATSTPTTTADPDPTTSTSSTTTSTSEVASTSTLDEHAFISSDISCLTGPRSARCSQCSPFEQNCSEGQKCTPYADDGGSQWNNLKCSPVDPNPGQPGESCTVQNYPASGLDSCDVGLMCWEVDEDTLIGTCILLCTGSSDMGICPEPLTCAVNNEGILPICLPQCDPLAQDCAPESACIANPHGIGFVCVLDASGDAGQALDPCEFVNACDPGLTCEDSTVASECDPDVIGCCTPFCDLTLPMNCPGTMQTCQSYFGMDPVPPGHENLGICSLP